MMMHTMRKLFIGFRVFLSAALLLYFLPMQATAIEWSGTPYIGRDLQSRHMAFRKSYSTGIDKNRYLQGSVYLGLNCNPFLGLEFGIEKSSTQSANPYLPYNSPYMGSPNTVLSGAAIKTKTTLRGYHGSVVGFLPMNTPFDLKLVGLFGLAKLQTKIVLKDYDLDTHVWSRPFIFNKKIWTPRLGVGAQTMIYNHVGLRAMVIWEKTSKFGYMLESENNTLILAPKNSLTPSIGLFYKF